MDDVLESGEEERRGRGLKPMKYVSKSSLIRKEQTDNEEPLLDTPETEATVREMANPIALGPEHRSAEAEGLPYLKNISPTTRSLNAAPLLDDDITYAKFMLDHTFNVGESQFRPELATKEGNSFEAAVFLCNVPCSVIKTGPL